LMSSPSLLARARFASLGWKSLGKSENLPLGFRGEAEGWFSGATASEVDLLVDS